VKKTSNLATPPADLRVLFYPPKREGKKNAPTQQERVGICSHPWVPQQTPQKEERNPEKKKASQTGPRTPVETEWGLMEEKKRTHHAPVPKDTLSHPVKGVMGCGQAVKKVNPTHKGRDEMQANRNKIMSPGRNPPQKRSKYSPTDKKKKKSGGGTPKLTFQGVSGALLVCVVKRDRCR